jgi:hypothetical protein
MLTQIPNYLAANKPLASRMYNALLRTSRLQDDARRNLYVFEIDALLKMILGSSCSSPDWTPILSQFKYIDSIEVEIAECVHKAFKTLLTLGKCRSGLLYYQHVRGAVT